MYLSIVTTREERKGKSLTGYWCFLEIISIVSFLLLLFNVFENLTGSSETFSEATLTAVSKQGKQRRTTDGGWC